MSKQEFTASSSSIAVGMTMPSIAIPSGASLAIDQLSRALERLGRDKRDIQAWLVRPNAIVFPWLDPTLIEITLDGRSSIQKAFDCVASYRSRTDLNALFRDISALAAVRPDSYRTSPE